MQNKDSSASQTYIKKQIMDDLEKQFSKRLKDKESFLYQDPGANVDMKRTPYRDITFYTINDIDKICSEPKIYVLKFVVTADYKLTLAQSGKPSYTVPDHLEMTGGKRCIAAGYLYVSPDKNITKIVSGCFDYATDQSSLIWPLLVLFKHVPEKLAHGRLDISHKVYDEVRYCDETKYSIIYNDLQLCLNNIQKYLLPDILELIEANLNAQSSSLRHAKELNLTMVTPLNFDEFDEFDSDSDQTSVESLPLENSLESLLKKRSYSPIFFTSEEFSSACATAKETLKRKLSSISEENSKSQKSSGLSLG
ncbi:MAG: hypothetical protein CK424_06715 [Legionella sp.]|nr:MAG: hypothetical protein CK424_06715 [Legionella sp.]